MEKQGIDCHKFLSNSQEYLKEGANLLKGAQNEVKERLMSLMRKIKAKTYNKRTL